MPEQSSWLASLLQSLTTVQPSNYSIADVEAMSPDKRALLYQGIPTPQYRPAKDANELLNAAGHAAVYMLPTMMPASGVISPAVTQILKSERGSIPLTGEKNWFHASHKDLTALTPRSVENVDSLGSWVSDNADLAKTLYGPKVVQAHVNPTNLLAAGTEDFDKVFYQNKTLFKELFPKKPVALLDKFKSYGLRQKDPELYKMRSVYLQNFRQMIEDAGYDGIVWRNSRIDTKASDPSHDVAVLFHKSDIPVTSVK